jgi:hypothetical protein
MRRGRDRFLGEGWLLPRLAKCSSSPGPPSIRSLILLRAIVVGKNQSFCRVANIPGLSLVLG